MEELASLGFAIVRMSDMPVLRAGVTEVGYGMTMRREVPVMFDMAPEATPSPMILDLMKGCLQAAIDGGHYTLPEGRSVEDVVSEMTFSPLGSQSFIGPSDVEVVQNRERGWMSPLTEG